MGRGFHRRGVLVAASVVSGLLACGRLADVPNDSGVLTSSTLVTLDVPSRSGSGVLRSHDFRTREAASMVLDEAANGFVRDLPVWSASGHWLMYLAGAPSSPRLVVRRHDADSPGKAWGEPLLANPGAFAALVGSNVTPSPKGDRFLLWREHGPTGTPIAIVSPGDDGTVDVREIHRLVGSSQSDVPYQRIEPVWTATGNRIVMSIREPSWPPRLVVFDVELAELGLPVLPSREVSPPDGLMFGEDGLGAVSSDGVWMRSTFRRVDGEASDALVVSLTDGTWRKIPGCGADERTGVACGFGPWHPSRPAAVITRGPKDARELVLWSPDDGELGKIPTVHSPKWVGKSHPRLLVNVDRRSRRLALVDFEGGAPVVTDVVGTDRETFSDATSSPDGRWLLLMFSELDTTWFEALDLDGDPSAVPREVERRTEADLRYALPTWGPPGSTSLLLRPQYFRTKTDEIERAVFVDLIGGKSTLLELSRAPRPSGSRPPWPSSANRLSADGNNVVLARDGKLAVWRKGTPTTDVVSIDDTSEWAIPFWPLASPPP